VHPLKARDRKEYFKFGTARSLQKKFNSRKKSKTTGAIVQRLKEGYWPELPSGRRRESRPKFWLLGGGGNVKGREGDSLVGIYFE